MRLRSVLTLAALVAAGLASVVGSSRHALAQSASATIEVSQKQTSIPAGADSILDGTYTLRNTGDAVIHDAQLAFLAGNGAQIPERYYFFREWIDGIEQPSPGVATIFDAGEIGPGMTRTIQFETIVRSSLSFAVDAVLLGAPNQHEIARTTVSVRTDAPKPVQTASLLIVPNAIDAPPTTVRYRLLVANDSDDTIGGGTVQVAGVTRDSVLFPPPEGSTQTQADSLGLTTFAIRDIAPHEQFETTLQFQSKERCDYIYPAVIVHGRLFQATVGGEDVALPALADADFSFNCTDTGGSGGGGELPAAGGGYPPDGRVAAWIVVLLLLGSAMIEAGCLLGPRGRRTRDG